MRRKWLIAVAVLAVALAAWFAWHVYQRETGGPARWNVLLITLDTTRADALGCYRGDGPDPGGRGRPDTPALDSLAASGIRCANAFTHVPMTLPSHATILTGLLPPEHGLRDNGRGCLGPDLPVLAEFLSRHGYRTSAFVGSFSVDKRFGLARGFDVYDDRMATQAKDGNFFAMECRGDVVVDRALAWLAQHADERFFSWVHFYDPHAPYDPPEPYRSRHAHPYDGEVAFVDAQVRRLLDFLDSRGISDRTLIVVCGDHGEGLGRHNEREHGPLVYNTTLHVPLLLHLPGPAVEGRVIDRVVGLADVVPTVLDVLGGRWPGPLSGRGILSRSGTDAESYAESEFLYYIHGWAPLYSLTADRWKYIDCPVPELYDLRADPGEQRNVLAAEPKTAEALKTRLAGLRRAMKVAEAPPAPLDEQAVNALSELGYLSGVGPGRRPANVEGLKDPKAMMHVHNACERAGELRSAGRHQEVVDLLAPLVAQSPESEALHMHLANSYFALGRFDDAKQHIEAELALNPDDRTRIARLGSALVAMGKAEEAVQALTRGLRLPPGRTESAGAAGASKLTARMRVDLGVAYIKMNRAGDAMSQWELAAREDPGNALAQALLADGLLLAGKCEAAVSHYRAALDAAARYPELRLAAVHTNYGLALAGLRRFGDAMAEHRKSLALDPNCAETHINLAEALLGDGQPDAALAEYNEAARVEPRSARPRIALGRELNRRNRVEEAVKSFREALELDPAAADARNELAQALCLAKRYAEGIEIWRNGLKADPENPFLARGLAWWLATCPDPACRNGADALKWATLASRKAGPNDPAALDALAAASAEAGRFDDAVSAARKALELARAQNLTDMAAGIERRLALYAASKPYHQSP